MNIYGSSSFWVALLSLALLPWLAIAQSRPQKKATNKGRIEITEVELAGLDSSLEFGKVPALTWTDPNVSCTVEFSKERPTAFITDFVMKIKAKRKGVYIATNGHFQPVLASHWTGNQVEYNATPVWVPHGLLREEMFYLSELPTKGWREIYFGRLAKRVAAYPLLGTPERNSQEDLFRTDIHNTVVFEPVEATPTGHETGKKVVAIWHTFSMEYSIISRKTSLKYKDAIEGGYVESQVERRRRKREIPIPAKQSLRSQFQQQYLQWCHKFRGNPEDCKLETWRYRRDGPVGGVEREHLPATSGRCWVSFAIPSFGRDLAPVSGGLP